MALNYNKITLAGRLVHTPELKTTPSGVSVCSFSIAFNRHTGDGNVADFFECTAWRQTAEFISKYFSKGEAILVEGQLTTRQYTDRQGNNRKAVEVKVDAAYFVEAKNAATSEESTQGYNGSVGAGNGGARANEAATQGTVPLAAVPVNFETLNPDDDLPF